MKRYFPALLCAAILATPAAAYDEFYARRLALGKQAFAEGNAAVAAEELRIACFGMLDAPDALTDCVARLALAQEGAGRTAEAAATVDRFLQLEARFGLFAKAALEPPLKASFRDLVKKKRGVSLATPVPAPTPPPPATAAPPATATPTVRPTSPPPVVPAVVPPVAPTATPTVRPTATPTATPAATSTPRPTATPRPAAAPPGLIGPPAPPTATPTPSPTLSPQEAREAAALGEAKKLVAENKAAAAKSLLTPIAVPGSGRDVRKALLEAAILTKDFRLAADQGSSLAPFREGEDSSMFYAAIALYETGKKSEARALVERCLTKLRPSPYVEYYAKKIRSDL